MSDTKEHPDVHQNGNGAGVDTNVYAPYSGPTFYSVGFPGMKSTAMEDQVDTWAAAGAIPFGVVVTKVSAQEIQCQAGVAGTAIGISLHDHLVAVYGGYLQYQAVSVMTRGRVWAAVDDAGAGIKNGVPVNYNPLTGKVTAATGTALTNAVFRTTVQQSYNILDGSTINIADVELHYPLV
jgi:hypothetical protein